MEAAIEPTSELPPEFYKYLGSVIGHFFGRFIHTCRISPGETLAQAVTRHEHYLASWLGVRKNQTILDIGCGNGGPALEIVKFLDVSLVGVDLNRENIIQAERYAAGNRLDDRTRFTTSDFMKLDLEDETFDGAYSLEATCYAPDLTAAYREAFRVLRPGAKFVVYESVLAGGFVEDNPEHQDILHRFERLFGHTGIQKASTAIEAMKHAGFDIELAEDLAERPSQIPWYAPVDGTYGVMASVSDTFFKNYYSFVNRSFRSRGILYRLAGALEKLRILPSSAQQDTAQVMDALDALRTVGQKRIVTTMFLMVARKPKP